MIEIATARRGVGDWAGACAAAGVDVDLDLRAMARSRGRALAAAVRADLRHLAPDLLRWHLPRVAPDGLLRPGLTMTLARYGEREIGDGGAGVVHLVARTPPAWADAGQRIALALWDGSGPVLHPHPHPNRRFRLDLHRHLWDARRVDELHSRSGAAQFGFAGVPSGVAAANCVVPVDWAAPFGLAADADFGSAEDCVVPPSLAVPADCAVHRWAAEAGILLRAEHRDSGQVLVRCGARQRVVLEVAADRGASPSLRIAEKTPRGGLSGLSVLPDAATWTLPDLALIRSGALTPDRLHPLVARALAPDHPVAQPHSDSASAQRIVECRGERHRIGLVDGVLVALDHDADEIRREELLVALTGTALPCLRAIDLAHRRPDWLVDVRERLHHGDIDGALTVVEGLLGRDAVLRDGPLRAELEAAARRRVTYGLFRAGLPAPGHHIPISAPKRRDAHRAHPRHATAR
ncbi:hypothetical protein [Nocardia asteroides]|uniref:hypothetical protein n=1 Tax=Nocardia asteroides TaxID=1824 RepID=UPI0033FD469B